MHHGEKNRAYEVEVELQLSPTVKLRVRGLVEASGLGEAVALAQELVGRLAQEYAPSGQHAAKRFPQDLLQHLESLTYRELVELLLYFEGPMSREQINQRTRELGKEVPRSWLDTEFFRKPYKDHFVADTDQSGVKTYKLSEKGKLEVEEIIGRLRG
ncbi:hypothetical protein HRbin02_01499 [Candidatus Calditenuaceae archaeon HR02]|nr:hypothetical protein HRbin02_01499 [Candidatus Calditenuaceae archaeon HR02]